MLFRSTQEDIFELVHPCIGEEQGLVAVWDHWRARHDLVTAGAKEIEKTVADLFGGHLFGISRDDNKNGLGLFKKGTLGPLSYPTEPYALDRRHPWRRTKARMA